uniref:Ribokinase n=1 Tax=Pyricularia oryzae (strain P131) TaxID=1143193 RepID=L7JLU6_PYRO1
MAQTPLITVLGSLNIDLVSYVPHHPLPGETLTANSFAVSPGGKGANQAIACAKLSRPQSDKTAATANVRMVGAVGADSYGSLLRSNLEGHGVDVSGVAVRADPAKTGLAIIVVDEPTGQNRIILSPESNHDLDKAVAIEAGLKDKPDLLIMQLEVPIPVVLEAMQAARTASVPVLLNPAPAVELPASAFEGLEHLIVNETEASVLGRVAESVLDTEEGLRSVADGFVKAGVRNVVITLGGRGVYFLQGWTGKAALVPALKATVVDTTAAGDTFVGMYALAAVAASKAGVDFDAEAAVRTANKAAAKTVERKGAQDSIPWRDEATKLSVTRFPVQLRKLLVRFDGSDPVSHVNAAALAKVLLSKLRPGLSVHRELVARPVWADGDLRSIRVDPGDATAVTQGAVALADHAFELLDRLHLELDPDVAAVAAAMVDFAFALYLRLGLWQVRVVRWDVVRLVFLAWVTVFSEC